MPEPAPPATRPPQRVGYARVSRVDQDPDHQIAALKKAGCEVLFAERVSGARRNRPQLDKALEYLRSGDTLIVWKLDRLGRSMKHLLELAASFSKRGIHLRTLTEDIDTHTSTGRLILGMMAVLAEFERELTSERTKLAARRRFDAGRRWGKPGFFRTRKRVELAKALLRNPDLSRSEVARRLGIATPTLYHWFPGGDPDRFGEGSKVAEAESNRQAAVAEERIARSATERVHDAIKNADAGRARREAVKKGIEHIASARDRARAKAKREAKRARKAAKMERLAVIKTAMRRRWDEKRATAAKTTAMRRERQQKIAQAQSLLANPRLSFRDVAKRVGVSPSTIYKWFPGGRWWDLHSGRHLGTKTRRQ